MASLVQTVQAMTQEPSNKELQVRSLKEKVALLEATVQEQKNKMKEMVNEAEVKSEKIDFLPIGL
jgi:hypothetical protein